MTNERIDVLAVMDRDRNDAACNRLEGASLSGLTASERLKEYEESRAARDAVAELIEAAKDAREMLVLVHDITGKVGTRLTAALARVQGGAA